MKNEFWDYETFDYDDSGNRITYEKQVPGEEFEEVIKNISYYPNTNHVKSDGEWGYVWDLDGNLVMKGKVFDEAETAIDISETEGEVWAYEWDAQNRLVRVGKSEAGTGNLQTITEYTYDHRGYRVKKVLYTDAGIETTYYTFGVGGEVLYKENTATLKYEEFVYVGGYYFAEITGTTDAAETVKYFYITDTLGSVTAMTDEDGRVVWTNEYLAFGNETGNTGFIDAPNIYGGHEFDEDVQLYYARARWYDSEMGRFITEDPARDGGNWFAYAANNPLKFVDPSGLYYVPADLPEEYQAAYEKGNNQAIEAAIFERSTEGLSDYVFQYYQQALKSNPGAFEGLGEKGKAMFFDMLLHTAKLYLWSQKTGENWDWSKFLGGMGNQLLDNITYFGNEIVLLNQFGTAGYAIFKGTQGALLGLTVASQIKDNGLFNLVDSAALDLVNYIKNNPEEVAGRTTSEIVQSILIAKGVAKLGEISKVSSLVDDAGRIGKSTINDVVSSSARARSNQITEGARAIAKKLGHAQRGGYQSAFEGIKATQENAGKLIQDILSNPTRVFTGDKVVDVYNSLGQGVRFEKATNTFIGFIEEVLATQ